ncbi:phosphoketolase family protein [Acidiferrobacter sp.]|uniref:phosphoketolase family protein n=1 Tax=Acidiferrobacter sp. TaxID=1872107 RepID=UPI0026382437|nr:phosphoketolase family protein [Acidiferrobacter sp.]
MFTFDATLSTMVETTGTPPPPSPAPAASGALSPELRDRVHRYWMAANYLTVGQIYLLANPLLREPLSRDHIKPRLLGHWGTSVGLNFIYAHLNRLIIERDVNMISIIGPGHGGPAGNANAWLEGGYAEIHHPVTQDEAGMRLLFRQFSTPGGVPSHCGAHLPGSINEGGELGYSLVHAFGAAFDNPDLVVACIVGDGEAETAPLEGSWKSTKFLNPVRDGAVLPILHLNGYKISGPTVLARISEEELQSLFRGHGYAPLLVEGDDPLRVHEAFAAALNQSYETILAIQKAARRDGFSKRPQWPMIILRTPKGWTGPSVVDGVPISGTFRAHQVPLATVRENPEHLALLEAWLRGYHPEQVFEADGSPSPELTALVPAGARRLSANPHANGGRLLTALDLPALADYALDIPGPGQVVAEAPVKLGEFLRDVFRLNAHNFRLFCPDETASNRLGAVFEATNRASVAEEISIDDHVSPDGRVMEVLSEHCCQGWLEGYLLTGRHGLWSSYESFAQITDSMLTQHAKWLKECMAQPWRQPIASLNVFLTSHAWRQDHNGYSHQAPGYVDNALAQKNKIVRIYFPPDGNCLLEVMDDCLRSRNRINVITCGKQPQLQWLTMAEAREHCSRGIGIWPFASNDDPHGPDVVLACAGDVPTVETLAAVWLLRKHVPTIRLRLVNVVDLGTLMRADVDPRGLDDMAFEELFPKNVPVVFVHHGYGSTVRNLVQGRPGDDRFHVRGYMNEGTTTTPFDMVVLNQIDRFHIAMDVLRRATRLRAQTADIVDLFQHKLITHEAYTRTHLTDLPEIENWHWTADFEDPKTPAPLAHPARGLFFTDS